MNAEQARELLGAMLDQLQEEYPDLDLDEEREALSYLYSQSFH